jgi:membrane protease YdiL (CAAX protease family)
VSYLLIGWAAWNDRATCRIFAPPRRGMVELCVVVGVGGAMLLAMLERQIRGWYISPIVWEKDHGWPILVCFVTISLLPAVFEELLFRGLLLQRLRGVLSQPQAIAVQAMLFALLHLDGSYLLPHFAFGCLAGLLRIAARALWPCMLLHGVWNGWLVLAEFGWL